MTTTLLVAPAVRLANEAIAKRIVAKVLSISRDLTRRCIAASKAMIGRPCSIPILTSGAHLSLPVARMILSAPVQMPDE